MNVYDFDDTIYDGESALDFFLAYMKVNPAMLKMLPKVLRAMARYKLGKVTVDGFMKDYAPLVKKYYCEYPHWEEFTVRFWDTHMHKIRPFYRDLHREDDIIVTASPELTVKEIAKRIGVKHYVCSQIDDETGEITRLCMRQKKEVYFDESFPNAEIENFYTDSMKNDGFFAKKAKHVFLVKGNELRQLW